MFRPNEARRSAMAVAVSFSGKQAPMQTFTPQKRTIPASFTKCSFSTRISPSVPAGLAELDELVGLQPVKEEVKKFVAYVQVAQKRKEAEKSNA